MFEQYWISTHAKERYAQRIGGYKKLTIEESIKRDLSTFNVRLRMEKDGVIRIFTNNSKEFIFSRQNGKIILKTVIKYNRSGYSFKINKMKQQLI